MLFVTAKVVRIMTHSKFSHQLEFVKVRQSKKKLPVNQLVHRELQNKFVKVRQVYFFAKTNQKNILFAIFSSSLIAMRTSF